jgi:hypothetical protein
LTSEYAFKPIECLAYGSGELELPKHLPPLPKIQPIKSIEKNEILYEKAIEGSKQKKVHAPENIPPQRKLKPRKVATLNNAHSVADNVSPNLKRSDRIKVPTNINLEPYRVSSTAKLSNYSLLLFRRAVYKTIFRIRANKRILALRRALQSGSPADIEQDIQQPIKDYLGTAQLTALPKRIHQNQQPQKVDIEMPPFPDIFQPRPIDLIIPSHAEEMGYTRIPLPEPKPSLCFIPPKLEIEQIGILI